jgi:ABC-2 type transport system ATP-binding protein
MHGPTPPAIEVDDLGKSYGEVDAVRGVSFTVPPGEVFGFLGPNGAGKSTTINVLCTLAKPTSGAARVSGFDVVTQHRAVRRHIGLVFQDPTLDGYLTAEQNLRVHAELYGIDPSVIGARIDQMLQMVDLADRRDKPVMTFSGGMRRRLEIARGLLHSPRVLFLDEPTSGLLDTPEALKVGIGADRVVLGTADDEAAIAALWDRFGIEAALAEGAVTFHVAAGEAFVPRLFAEWDPAHPGITSVAVSRPTLDDVFMRYTGTTIRDAEAGGASGQSRAMMRAVAGAPR